MNTLYYERWELAEEIVEKTTPQIVWSPRKFVKSAERLTIANGTKVFPPDWGL